MQRQHRPDLPPSIPLRSGLAYSVVGLSLSLVAAVALWSSDRSTPSPSRSGTDAWALLRKHAAVGGPAASPLRLLEQEFRTLAGRGETPPARIQMHLEETLGAPRGAFHIVNSHYLVTRQGNAWAVTGADLTCVVEAAPLGALACNTTVRAARRGLALGLVRMTRRGHHGRRDYVLIGIAPDWVDSVQVRVGPRRQTSLPVHNNSYAMNAPVPVLVKRLCSSRPKCIEFSTIDRAVTSRNE